MSTITMSPNASADEHGNPTAGPAEAIAHYDAAIDRLVRYHVDVVDLMASLAADHPTFAMGQALAAYLHLMSTDARDLDTARDHLAALHAAPRNDRESAHATAIDAWLDGKWHRAARHLDDLLIEWPTDVLALMIGHQLDFFLGDARNLRDRVGRSIGAFDPQHPHYGFVRGMQAFGLEESGHYGLAEQAALDAVDRNPDDVWGVHAGAHVYEMQGLVDDGIAFMTERVDDWGAAICSPSTTGGTSRCTTSNRVATTRCSRSTTARSTTLAPTASRSRCSTPAPCCGGFGWMASTSPTASM